MSTKSHELTGYTHPSLGEIGVFVPPQAVSFKLTDGQLSVSTNPSAPLDILRVTIEGKTRLENPAAEIVLDFFKRAPEHSESLQTPDRESLTQAIQAGLVAQRIFDNFHSSVGVTQGKDSDELRSYRGSKLPPRVSHYLDQRGRYLRVTGERIREAQESLEEQLKRAKYWLSRLPDPPRVDQLPKAVRAAGGIAAAAATVVTPLAAQADAKTAEASHVSIATEFIEPHYAFQSQGMSETRVNTADLAYLMSLPPIPEEKTPSHVDQEGSEFIATPQTPSEPTPTATVQKKSSVDYQIRSLANTNSESYGTISQVIGNQPFEVDAEYHDGTHTWYRVTLSSETSENRSGWIRGDGINILPNEAGQIPDLPDLTVYYNLAASMRVLDSKGEPINDITGLDVIEPEVLGEIQKIFTTGERPFPQENFAPGNLDIISNHPGEYILKLNQDSAGNPKGSFFYIKYNGQQLENALFIPTNILEEQLTAQGLRTDINVQPTSTAGILSINPQARLDTNMFQNSQGSFDESLAGVDPSETRAEVNPDDKQGFIEANGMLGQILDAIEQSDPVFIHENVIDSVGNGYLGDITVNGIDHALMAGTVIFHHRLVNEVNTIVYIVVGVPDVNGGTSYFQMDIPYSDSFFGPRPMLFVENYEGLQNASPEGTTPEAIGAQLGQYRNYTEFVQNVLEPLRVGDIVVLTMPRNDKLTPFIEGVQFGDDFSGKDTFVSPGTPRAEEFLSRVWPKSADDQHALIMPGTMSVTDLDETPLFIALSPLSSP